MEPLGPPKLTRLTMNKASGQLKEEITENLNFLQRQMEVHYGQHSTFRSDSTIQFLAKMVGQTRRLREQWTRYVECDPTIREEFPKRLPRRPKTEAEKAEGEVRRDDLIKSDNDPNKRLFKVKKTKKRQETIPVQYTPAKEPHKPKPKNMWSQRTTTTIFDGSYRMKKRNKNAQQSSASYIQEPVYFDGTCDKMVNGRQCRFDPYYDCPRHYPALPKILKKQNGQRGDDTDEQNYYAKYVDEDGNQLPYGQINAVYRFPPGAGVDRVDWWGMPRIHNPNELPLI